MKKTIFSLLIGGLLFLSTLGFTIGANNSEINQIIPINNRIIGLFPSVTNDNITYLSLLPLGMLVIPEEKFDGYMGNFLIIGKLLEDPIASFTYEPSEDKLRVINNTITFASTSTDPDGDIIEQWWQFEEGGEWIKTNNPFYIYNESGYHQVTLRVIDNDGLNDTFYDHIRVYERLPTYQCIQNIYEGTLSIVGYHVVGSTANYDWIDFENIGNGSCILPNDGHPIIGDIITNCSGEIIIQYVPNGVISCEWMF